jgi:NAD(P)-dependent dehydrogenase (short-subunit alcohol dehydrogenase family)
MRLAGKVAIISGAASGMGAATARMFAREGNRMANAGATIRPALRGAKVKLKGVELMCSPMRADDPSTRFRPISLKTK